MGETHDMMDVLNTLTGQHVEVRCGQRQARGDLASVATDLAGDLWVLLELDDESLGEGWFKLGDDAMVATIREREADGG